MYARGLNVKVSAGVAMTVTTTRKSKKLNRQNSNSSLFFVHFFPVTYTTTSEKCLISRFMEDVAL